VPRAVALAGGAVCTAGDGIRRHIDPSERALFRDALLELNRRRFPGSRGDTPIAGGVTMWFKQDEINQATHVHGTPEFVPRHRELVNRLEAMLRDVHPDCHCTTGTGPKIHAASPTTRTDRPTQEWPKRPGTLACVKQVTLGASCNRSTAAGQPAQPWLKS
jgi:hypothetical protein